MSARIYCTAPSGFELSYELVRRAARAALRENGEDGGELSITFLTDGPIRSLNRRWLGHDWVPDVLSFALHEPGDPPIGDIYVGIDQAARQAVDHGISLTEELVRLVIHGTLHVLGGDHPEEPGERDDSPLYRIQEALVEAVLEAGR